MAEIPLSLDAGRKAGGCRAPDRGRRPRRDVSRVGRWRGQAAMAMGHVARATQRGEKAVNGRGVRHDRAHRHAPCAPGAARDVHVEGAAQEGGPIHAGKRRVERVAKESVPVRDGEDARGYLQRRPRHEERRRRRSRSGRDERRPFHAARTAPAPAARCAGQRRRRHLAWLSPLPRSSCSSAWTTTSCILPAIPAGAAPRALAMGGAPQAPRAAEEGG